jgi:hypothetical protein
MLVLPVPEIKVPERHSGLRLSGKELPERHSGEFRQKIPLLTALKRYQNNYSAPSGDSLPSSCRWPLQFIARNPPRSAAKIGGGYCTKQDSGTLRYNATIRLRRFAKGRVGISDDEKLNGTERMLVSSLIKKISIWFNSY